MEMLAFLSDSVINCSLLRDAKEKHRKTEHRKELIHETRNRRFTKCW